MWPIIKVGHQAQNQWKIMVMAMSIKQITLRNSGLDQFQDQFQDHVQSPNHLPDQDPPPLQCQGTAHPTQVHSCPTFARLKIQSPSLIFNKILGL